MRQVAQDGRRETEASEVWMRITRVVMISLLVILALTPISQSIWSGDNLFQVNGDTEYTLSMSLTVVSLSLLLSRQKLGAMERAVDCFHGMMAVLLSIFYRGPLLLRCQAKVAEAIPIPVPLQDSGVVNLPLLI